MTALRNYYDGESLDRMVELLRDDYLAASGWLNSAERKEAVDADGRPVPWITYPALEMLKRIVRPEWEVFEYGSGNGTLWWAERVAFIASVEHDPYWANHVRAQISPAHYCAHAEGADYVDTINRTPRSQYDVVVIDGEDRVSCCAAALPRLKEDGIVILDNSDRNEYAPGIGLVNLAGFARIDFWGLGPIKPYGWCTSIFARTLKAFSHLQG